jgi:hypothetical protein
MQSIDVTGPRTCPSPCPCPAADWKRNLVSLPGRNNNRESKTENREFKTLNSDLFYDQSVMSKKPRKKKSNSAAAKQRQSKRSKPPRYTPGEIALAILGAAILIMIAGIVITSILE